MHRVKRFVSRSRFAFPLVFACAVAWGVFVAVTVLDVTPDTAPRTVVAWAAGTFAAGMVLGFAAAIEEPTVVRR